MNFSKLMSFIFTAAGIITALWFLLPVFTHGLVNIGNVTGLSVALLLLVYGIGMRRINSIIVRFWHFPAGKALLSLAGACAVVIIGFAVVLTSLMVNAMLKKPESGATAVVLGCRVYSERASLMLNERIDAAYLYLSENPGACCVLSGGKGAGEDITEAECMRRALTEMGISPERIYIEDKSTSTRENLSFAKKVIEENGLNPSIAVVTNEFHEYRAARIAAKLGAETGAVNGKTAWWLFPTFYVRELYGIMYEIFL